MKIARLRVTTASGPREVSLDAYLTADDQEQAVVDAHRWIKTLRHLDVDGEPLRRRFTFRGDSLWWFAELYLHKTEVVRDLFAITAALEHLVARERPSALAVTAGNHLVHGIAAQVARRNGVHYDGPQGFVAAAMRLARLRLRAVALTYAAVA